MLRPAWGEISITGSNLLLYIEDLKRPKPHYPLAKPYADAAVSIPTSFAASGLAINNQSSALQSSPVSPSIHIAGSSTVVQNQLHELLPECFYK